MRERDFFYGSNRSIKYRKYCMGNCSNNSSITYEYSRSSPFYGGLAKKEKCIKHNVFNFNSILSYCNNLGMLWISKLHFGSTLNGIIGFPSYLFMSGLTLNSMHGSIPNSTLYNFSTSICSIN